jgi:CrcB protein
MNSAFGRDFPYGTLAVNLIGSFLMGVLLAIVVGMLPRGRELYLLVGVGALGGFTTFSAFSYDAYILLERQLYLQLFLYVAGSVLIALAAFFAGMWMMKSITA